MNVNDMKELSRNLPGRIEENYEETQSRLPESGQKYETRIF
jgi:hypothetical protein